MVTDATLIIQEQLTRGAQLVEIAAQLWMALRHHSTLQHIQKELQEADATLDQVRASTTSTECLAILENLENLFHNKHVI